MKRHFATNSLAVDTIIKRDLDELAAEEGRSKSDIFREMYNYYTFKSALRRAQEHGVLIAARLGLETDDDVYEHLRNAKQERH